MEECIFCKIVNNEIPSEKVFESDSVLAFQDINPKAPVHILIIPKKHIKSIASESSEEVAKELITVAKQIAMDKGIVGYKLLFNVGKEGGQMVDHLHLHLLSGKVVELL
ncbi:MAG: histidine triad nucleotide-binding protein [Parcubacteria group bacterium]|nr:histidine triad nucleotide-binding protein [Parcubacteria group bacterium]